MIKREIDVVVTDKSITLKTPIILYKGDGVINLEFHIQDGRYKYTTRSATIFRNALKYNATILQPNRVDYIQTEKNNVIGGEKINIQITKEMISRLESVGFFKMQIHFYDEEDNRVSLPPFTIEIRGCIAEIDNDPDTPTPPQPQLEEYIYYGRIALEETGNTETITPYSDITADMIKNAVAVKRVECTGQTLGKTSLGKMSEAKDFDYHIVAVPSSRNYVVTKDNGIGGKVRFTIEEDGAGANGEVKLMIDGVQYDIYGQFFTGQVETFIYVDK